MEKRTVSLNEAAALFTDLDETGFAITHAVETR
ncbi:MAG: hypothetical protein K0R47_2120 [Brevibacillus sp.]|nr:hypothetical protein [Brevibacillus sp.]